MRAEKRKRDGSSETLQRECRHCAAPRGLCYAGAPFEQLRAMSQAAQDIEQMDSGLAALGYHPKAVRSVVVITHRLPSVGI